jgi:hypothetical protein
VGKPTANGQMFTLENAIGSAFMICTSSATIGNSQCAVDNGADWTGYSDAGTTLSYDFNASNGTALFTGTVTGGGILSNAALGVGYTTGAGGTVTQITSRTTGVTLNKAAGAITLFTGAGSATPATFTVTDSAVSAADTITLSVKSATNIYLALVTAVAAGSFNVTFYTTGGTSSDAPVLNFAVVKGATS